MLRGWKESGLTEAHFRHERLSQAFHRGIGLSARYVFRLMRAGTSHASARLRLLSRPCPHSVLKVPLCPHVGLVLDRRACRSRRPSPPAGAGAPAPPRRRTAPPAAVDVRYLIPHQGRTQNPLRWVRPVVCEDFQYPPGLEHGGGQARADSPGAII